MCSDYSVPGVTLVNEIFRLRPITRRPEPFCALRDYWDERRTTTNHGGGAAAMLKYSSLVTFLDMTRKNTYADLEESADRFFRFKRFLQLEKLSPDYELMALAGLCLIQHDVMIIRGSEDVSKKFFAYVSFMNHFAGEWQKSKGDMLLFPAPEGTTNYSHLKKTARDIIFALKCVNRIRRKNINEGYACLRADRKLADDDYVMFDRLGKVLMVTSGDEYTMVFKPIFHSTCFTITTVPNDKTKIVFTLELLQRAVLIYIKLADLALASGWLGKALALCRLMRHCCDQINYILNVDLDLSAYTHITTNWITGKVFVQLYFKRQLEHVLYDDEYDFHNTREEVEEMFACVADMRTDLWEMTQRRKLIEYRSKFPKDDKQILEESYRHFSLVSAPADWKRTTYFKMFVQCKVFYERYLEIIDTFANMARSAHSVNLSEPKYPDKPAKIKLYNFELNQYEGTSEFSRPLVVQQLDDFLTFADEVRANAYHQLGNYTFCNDLKALLSVLVGLVWKVKAVSDAASSFHGNQTDRNPAPVTPDDPQPRENEPQDSSLRRKEYYCYRKMRLSFHEALHQGCREDIVDEEASRLAYGFRISLAMKAMREEVAQQIERERRIADYRGGVLGLVKALNYVYNVRQFEQQLPGDDSNTSSKAMTANFLFGLSQVYLTRYEKLRAKVATNEESRKELMDLLHNACYYQYAFAMYIRVHRHAIEEVCRTFVDHAELVADFYCRGGTPLAALVQDVMALRRLMPLLPILWECCIDRLWLTGPKGYEKIEMTAIQLPFCKPLLDKALGQSSAQIRSTFEQMQIPKANLALEGDAVFDGSGEIKDEVKRSVDKLTNCIWMIAIDEVKAAKRQNSPALAAKEIASIICTAKGVVYSRDSVTQKIKLAQHSSAFMVERLVEHLEYFIWGSVGKSEGVPKTSGYISKILDKAFMAFSSTFAVLCGIMAVYAVDYHWPNSSLWKDVELWSTNLVSEICDVFYRRCTAPPHTIVPGKFNAHKLRSFLKFCSYLQSMSISQSEDMMDSGVFTETIVRFSAGLKRFSVHGSLKDVPLFEMVIKTTQLFAYRESHTDETWRSLSAKVARCLSISLMKSERKAGPYVNSFMEPKYENEPKQDDPFRISTYETRPNPDEKVGQLPTNVEQFHVVEETEYSRGGKMYTDKVFEDIFSSTLPAYTLKKNFIRTSLRRLVSFLRTDLDRLVKEDERNPFKPPSKLYGTLLTKELLKKLDDMQKYIERPSISGDSDVRILKVFQALDIMFFRGSTSPVLRGTLQNELL